MTIDVVLFDYSGVLTTGLHLPTENVPFDPDLLLVEMVNALSGTDGDPWHELERGEISLDAYIDLVEERVPGAGAMFSLKSDLNVMRNLEVLDDRIALAQDLKAAGKRVGVVTNNVAEWQPLWLPRLPVDLFEIIIDSSVAGCRKPEAAIYEVALAQLAVTDPSTVLFIDDFEWNVAGATAVGMVGLHCTAAIDLRAAVMDLV